jgi:predicted 3-demethylubiquinone-9 3-methyltransferase (glyoxalase superfamily)
MMKAPIPFLWFEKDTENAANFHVPLLPNSRIARIWTWPVDSPFRAAGSVRLDVAKLQAAFDGALEKV